MRTEALARRERVLDAREIVVKASEDKLRETHAEFDAYQTHMKQQLQAQLNHLQEIEQLQSKRVISSPFLTGGELPMSAATEVRRAIHQLS